MEFSLDGAKLEYIHRFLRVANNTWVVEYQINGVAREAMFHKNGEYASQDFAEQLEKAWRDSGAVFQKIEGMTCPTL